MLGFYYPLTLCGILSTAAFTCEIPCPQNAECIGEEKCSCIDGYKATISEYDGLPYCKWQGTTTTKRTLQHVSDHARLVRKLESATKSSLNITHLQEDEDLVDDNGELFGDYRYQRDQQEKEPQTEVVGELSQPNSQTLNESTTLKSEIFAAIETTDEVFITTEVIANTTAEISWTNNDTSHTNETTYKGQNLASLDMFYNLLALFCMCLAFLFVVSVLYGCVKL